MSTRRATPDDDEAWAAALAGRDLPGARPETRLEAALLRAAARQQAAVPLAAASADERQRMAAVLAAMVASAPTPARAPAPRPGWSCGACARRWAWLQQAWSGLPRGAAVAAGLALVAPMLVWWLPAQQPGLGATGSPAGADTTLRGTEAGVSLRAHRDAEQQRNLLAQRLAAHGAKLRRYERLGRFGLDAQWPLPLPQPLPPTLLQALQDEGLELSSDGLVRVEFTPSVP